MTDSEVPQGNQDGASDHTVGSHSDDRGGSSDFPCYCDRKGNSQDTEGVKALSSKADNRSEPLTQIYNVFAELHAINYHTDASERQWEQALLNAHGKVKEVVSDLLATGSKPPQQPSDAPSNGSGSQDSIDDCLDKIYAVAVWHEFVDKEDRPTGKGTSEIQVKGKAEAKKALKAWHNTQLKAAIPEKRPGNKQVFDLGNTTHEQTIFSDEDAGFNKAIDTMQANLEEQGHE